MSRPEFHLSVAMCPPEELAALAKGAEEAGFDRVAVPDSIFWSEQVSAPYPYTATGKRMWTADTPFVDPFIAIATMAAVTERIRFTTNVIKLAVRHPVLVAKTVSSLAALADGRLGLGVGLGWLPEEFTWCGADFKTRGPRANEAISILRKLLSGDAVSHEGEHYAFGTIRLNPTSRRPVPIYVGGHSAPGLRRAARLADGWMGAMMFEKDLDATIARLNGYRAEYGRLDEPWEVHATVLDVWDDKGFMRLGSKGLTAVVTVPWILAGKGLFVPLEAKLDAIAAFGERIAKLG